MSEEKERWFAPDSWDREHELRLQAERECDRLRKHADALAEAMRDYATPSGMQARAAYLKEFGE